MPITCHGRFWLLAHWLRLSLGCPNICSASLRTKSLFIGFKRWQFSYGIIPPRCLWAEFSGEGMMLFVPIAWKWLIKCNNITFYYIVLGRLSLRLSFLHSKRSCIWLWVGVFALLVAMWTEAGHSHDVSPLEIDNAHSCLLCQQGFDNLKLYIHSYGLIVPVAAVTVRVLSSDSAVAIMSIISAAIRAPPIGH